MYVKKHQVIVMIFILFLCISYNILSYAQKDTKIKESEVNMLLNNKNSIINILHYLNRYINNTVLNSIWKNFEPSPFALYNNEKVYLINLSIKPDKQYVEEEGVIIFDWDKRFFGNTAIKYNQEYIAIWNLDYTPPTISREKLYASIVHEMFHAYQQKCGDRRYGNELIFTKYPFTTSNIAKRFHERRYLVSAVLEENERLKKDCISKFISYRESRRKDIGNFLDYELGQESREGTARYVECQAHEYLSSIPHKYLISKYGDDLWNYPKDFTNFRASCYSSGFYICLLLDEFCPRWTEDYMSSEEYLYDFFKAKMKIGFDEEVEVNNYEIAEYMIAEDRKLKDKRIKDFFSSDGYKIELFADFKLAGFDPMNIVCKNNFILHKNFFGFLVGDRNYFIQKPVLIVIGEDMMDIREVIFFSMSKPEVKEDMISIEGVGDFRGKMERIEGGYRVNLE